MSSPAANLLRNAPHRPPASLDLGAGAALRLARLHEVCGDARRTLALMIAARTAVSREQPLIWIAPAWATDRLHGDGMTRFMPPGQVIFVTPNRAEDILWTMEEVLRAGATPLAVADLPGLPTLTAVRRMHLAAETGAAESSLAPIGLILTEGDGGAPGVETRWHMGAAHTPAQSRAAPSATRGRAPEIPIEGTGWRLECRRNRTAPPRAWQVTDDHRLIPPPDGGLDGQTDRGPPQQALASSAR
ncbi:MAG: ImuA family protein [Pseudooceanicola sp.]